MPKFKLFISILTNGFSSKEEQTESGHAPQNSSAVIAFFPPAAANKESAHTKWL
jgi:hypothetical protein